MILGRGKICVRPDCDVKAIDSLRRRGDVSLPASRGKCVKGASDSDSHHPTASSLLQGLGRARR
eukprot:12176908-Alexandrium_andersonii.AAC.1